MKNYLLFITILFLSLESFAGSVVWSCKKGSLENVVTVSVNPYPGEDGYILQINDPQIIAALGFSSSYWMSIAKQTRYGYEAIPQAYAQGIDFQFESGGVKLVRADSTSDGIIVNSNSNWYFNPGECTQP